MVVMVISRIQQAFARSAFYSNVVGDSMLARLRNSTIALLGVVTAVGLGLVAFISQLGLPGVFNGAIPDGPGGPVGVHGAIALTQKAKVGPRELRFRGHRVSTRIRSSPLGRSDPTADADLGVSKHAGHGLPGQSPSVSPSPHPPSTPAPGPAGEPEAAPPAPTTGSAGSPESDAPAQPKEQSSAKSNQKARGHSRAKSKSQAGVKTDASSTGGSKSRKPEKAKRHSGAPSRPGGDSPGKSGESESPPPKPPSEPPPAKPSEKEPPGAGGKDSWDAGKSDRSHH
jgi:hypothetical protein